jgi:hypothetical protein
MSAIAERVAAGAAWLDIQRPEWLPGIDLGRLDLSNPCLCVLGQVFAAAVDGTEFRDYGDGYSYAVNQLEAPESAGGFTINPITGESFADLDEAWRELITERRSAS